MIVCNFLFTLEKDEVVAVKPVQVSAQIIYTFPSGCNTDIEDPTHFQVAVTLILKIQQQ